MGLVIAAAAITFILIFALALVLLTARTPESARLMALTASTQVRPAAEEKLKESLVERGWISGLANKLRELLGSSGESDLARRMAMAGYRRAVHADLFYLVKFALPVVAVVTSLFLVRENRFFWVVVAGAVGFLLPDLWLTHAMSKRRDTIRLSLPDALDLLVICLEAGLGLDQAIVRVGRELQISHPELSDELLLINLEQRAGKPRVDAWRNMADRTGVESARQFVQMLVQTERFGTPISKSLGAFADALRVRRRQQAEEMAAKTTIKLIPPLVLFIFPSLFIVLLGPAVIMIARNLLKVLAGQ